MADSIERALESALVGRCHIGQILVQKTNDGFNLCHRDDQAREDLQTFQNTQGNVDIAKYDDAGNYRPLKTAPNLRHGWRIEVATWEELKCALDYFYPGRLAVFVAWKSGQLGTTSLRQTLNRQSGMYRVAAKISDNQIDNAVGDFCRSDGGCLRTILWKRDQRGAVASTKLPKEKFDTTHDQARAFNEPGSPTLPLFCQEACNLLVAECRKVVKAE